MSDFVTIAKVGEIPEGKGRRFTVGERQIAVFHVGGRYYALDDRCPHMGASLAVGIFFPLARSDTWGGVFHFSSLVKALLSFFPR